MHLLDACTRVQPEIRSDKEERITMFALKTNQLRPIRSFEFESYFFQVVSYDEYETGREV